jgi:predicted nucleotidyltransferase
MIVLRVESFLCEVVAWAEAEQPIDSVMLVGSFARDEAQADSDVDLVILTRDRHTYLENAGWATRFGEVLTTNREIYGPLESLRIHYADGLEVEFGFADLNWVTVEPLDEGTVEVVAGGMRILLDKSQRVEAFQRAVSQ